MKPKSMKPPIMRSATTTRGNLGRFLRINLRCGWNKTKNTQKTAKYIIYGVKIDSSIATAKAKQYKGLGRFSP